MPNKVFFSLPQKQANSNVPKSYIKFPKAAAARHAKPTTKSSGLVLLAADEKLRVERRPCETHSCVEAHVAKHQERVHVPINISTIEHESPASLTCLPPACSGKCEQLPSISASRQIALLVGTHSEIQVGRESRTGNTHGSTPGTGLMSGSAQACMSVCTPTSCVVCTPTSRVIRSCIGGGGKGNVQGVVFGKRRKGFRGAQTHA